MSDFVESAGPTVIAGPVVVQWRGTPLVGRLRRGAVPDAGLRRRAHRTGETVVMAGLCWHDYYLGLAQLALRRWINGNDEYEALRRASAYLELLRHQPTPDDWLPLPPAVAAFRAELDRWDEACGSGQP